MKTEMQVLEHLAALLPEGIKEHLESKDTAAPISPRSILIDFPDPDNMRTDNMLYIVPEYENMEELTVSSDSTKFEVKVYILSKKGTNASLVKRIFDIYSAFYLFMRKDPTLGGFIDYSRITDMDYYPAVTAQGTMVGIEITLTLLWAKNY